MLFNKAKKIEKIYYQSEDFYENQEYDKAISKLNDAIRMSKQKFRILDKLYSLKGTCYFKKLKFEEAYENLLKAIEANPEILEYYLECAHYARLNKNKDDAIKLYKDALHLAPNCIDIYLNLGFIYLNYEETSCEDFYKESKEYFKMALDIDQELTLKKLNERIEFQKNEQCHWANRLINELSSEITPVGI